MVTFLIVAGCWLAGSLLGYWLTRLLHWCVGMPFGRMEHREAVVFFAAMPIAFLIVVLEFIDLWVDPDSVRRSLTKDHTV